MHPVYRKSEHVVERTIRGEHLIVPIMADEDSLDSIYALNEMAARIWEAAGSGVTPETIVETLLNEYDADSAEIRNDVYRILDELVEAKALVREETA